MAESESAYFPRDRDHHLAVRSNHRSALNIRGQITVVAYIRENCFLAPVYLD